MGQRECWWRQFLSAKWHQNRHFKIRYASWFQRLYPHPTFLIRTTFLSHNSMDLNESQRILVTDGIVGLGPSLLFCAFIPCLLLCVLQIQLAIVSVGIGLVLAWVLVGEKKKKKKQSASKPGSWQHFPKLFFFSLTYCPGSPGLRYQGQFHFLYSSIAMALGAALCPLCGSTTLYSLMYVYWKTS